VVNARALRLPVVGKRDEQVAAGRELGGPVQAADLLVDLAQHGASASKRLIPAGGRPRRVAEEVGVDARPARQHVR
jgi:hypothetical protein